MTRRPGLRPREPTAQPARRHGGNLPGLGAVEVADCKLKDADVVYRAYQLRRGNLVYAAEGLAGYDSALQLG